MPAASSYDRRRLLIGGAMTATAALTFGARARMHHATPPPRPLARMIPAVVGAWRVWAEAGTVLPSPALAENFADQALAREYRGPSLPPVALNLAWSATQTASVHLHNPETCYAVVGYAITGLVDTTLPLGGVRVPARRFTAQLAGEHLAIAYWRRMGTAFPQTRTGDWRALAGAALAGTMADGAMVMVALPDSADADRQIAAFASALVAACDAPTRALLIGASRAAAA
jgi:EpsI family protein